MNDLPAYSEYPWPPIRNVVVDFLETAHATHTIHGLLEVDASKPLKLIRQYQRAMKHAVSFSAFLLYCLGKSVDKHKDVQAYRKGKKLIVFDDVDINTMIEKRKPDGALVPVSYIIRAANRKSLAQINLELRQAVSTDLHDDKNVQKRARLTKLPKWIRRIIWRRIEKDPFLHKQHRGTVGLTNASGAASQRPGWLVPITPVTCGVSVGGIYEKVYLTKGIPETRRTLCLTVSVNHDIVDGAPAVRFGETFIQLIENAEGLDENFVKEYTQLHRETYG